MKKVISRILPVLAVALVIAMGSSAAFAQGSTVIQLNPIPGSYDVFTTNYFSNNNVAGAPHGTLRVSNDGSSQDDLCANVYVFDDSQELKECCSCPITPNGMRTWDINTDLNANPANGRVANQGVIQIFSTHDGPIQTVSLGSITGSATIGSATCDPTFGFNVFYGNNVNVYPEPELESWATHIQALSPTIVTGTGKTKAVAVGTYSATETQSIEEEMSGDEMRTLVLECAFATAGSGFGQGSGSGTGVCGCGFEL